MTYWNIGGKDKTYIYTMGFIESSSWRRHQMETFSALLALCAGNSPVTREFPPQRPVTRSFDVFVNNREAGDLRRHRIYYDITVIL